MSVVSFTGSQEEPLVVVQNGKYGFIDHQGKIIIQPQFVWADDFWRGLATVYVCGRYVSIEPAGTLLPLRIALDSHLEPQNRGDKVGFVGADGQFKISPTFDEVLPFSEGLAAVRTGDKWGFVDAGGHQVIQPKFKAAFYFREGVAVVEMDSGFSLINRSGKEIASGFEFVDVISNGRIPATRRGKGGYLDLSGRVAIPFLYESVRSFSRGLAAVKKDGKWGYLDQDGHVVIPFGFNEAGPFASGLAPVKVGSKTGFIDESGKFSFYLSFSQAPGFLTGDSETGLFTAESDVSRFWTDDGKFGYVKKSGEVIWGPTEGSPDHPPQLGWSDEANATSCEGIPEVTKTKIAGFPRD